MDFSYVMMEMMIVEMVVDLIVCLNLPINVQDNLQFVLGEEEEVELYLLHHHLLWDVVMVGEYLLNNVMMETMMIKMVVLHPVEFKDTIHVMRMV